MAGNFPKLGPTGRFPEGKLNEQDEGELRIAVQRDGNNVVVHFGKEVLWLGMGPALAKELAGRLYKMADEIQQDEREGGKCA